MSGGRKVDWEAAEKGERGASGAPPPTSATRKGDESAFRGWFERFTGHPPHGWQERLALDSSSDDRLVRVPTGLGKTAGVVAAWAWNRLERGDESWPRRLAFCLPMRVLVEQTEACVREWLGRADLLWDRSPEAHRGKVGVHVLMGGVDADEWHLYPEECAVLLGTQDMLLSRALNRGYGCARARWPMEFAQLHQDCLWVLDEVQLMDVGLATSVQLQAFRASETQRALPLARSWWMSATLQEDWLRTCVDFADRVGTLPRLDVLESERIGPLWEVRKDIEVVPIPRTVDEECSTWAEFVIGAHRGTSGGITLAVANTVRSACALYARLRETLDGQPVDVRLAHSRFRGIERAGWRGAFLSREACRPGANRIVVATQVIEAGVDVSADALVTELAPWPSLVQRFGRCARYGGTGRVVVVDRLHDDASAAKIQAKKEEDRDAKRRADDEQTALPYTHRDVAAAAAAARELRAADPAALERFERGLDAAERARLYPYEPTHVLARRELDDLFDTGPDLTGADLDVSRFVRSGDERDVTVWWWPVAEDGPLADLQAARNALCPVPVGDTRKWLARKGEDGAARARAWVWDYLDDEWRLLRDRDIYPGQTILVDSAEGGYSTEVGFTGKRPDKKTPAIPVEGTAKPPPASLRADLAQEQDDLCIAAFKTIATHGAEAAEVARGLAGRLGLATPVAQRLDLAARAHDLGKSHPVFAAAIKNKNPYESRNDLAKAPDDRWHAWQHAYTHATDHGPRRGFRHELASTLALFELVRRARPDHPALVGEHRALLDAAGIVLEPLADADRLDASGFTAELSELDGDDFDLVAWLVCTHHGKVRATWQATPSDQEYEDRDGRGQPLRGVRDGDALPATAVADGTGGRTLLPPVALHLDPAALGLSPRYGPSWVERVARLRERWGPFTLAFLETLLRVADVRASRLATADPLLSGGR
jgi:CRISPR-associated endonuclease/helicase Cas3